MFNEKIRDCFSVRIKRRMRHVHRLQLQPKNFIRQLSRTNNYSNSEGWLYCQIDFLRWTKIPVPIRIPVLCQCVSAPGEAISFERFFGIQCPVILIGDKLKKYDDAIERNGFATVLYLRLVYFPFTPMNFSFVRTSWPHSENCPSSA